MIVPIDAIRSLRRQGPMVGSVGAWLLASWLLWSSSASSRAGDAASLEFFEKSIRPLLIERCYPCHSSGAEKGIKGGLNLESREGWLKGGENGPAIVPGDPERSLLIKAVRYKDENLQMPPKNKPLTAEQVAFLETWVKMGAPDPRTGSSPSAPTKSASPQEHWAFRQVKPPVVPAVKNRSSVRTPVDAFLLAGLEAKGLRFSPEADRRTLIRRATFDLTGLPPTPAEAKAFENDKSPEAYSTLIDRLLASPHYGERWGRYWLDVARYADTKGYVFEEERRYPYSYTYRDYVIRAFNEDLPYNRFLVEQLAADLLPLGADQRPLAALGFLTLGRRFLNNQADIIDDRIDVMTRGMMGLTVVCARCHDHKFDPVPTKDYYSLYGVFASAHEPEEKPLLGEASIPKEYPEYLKDRQKVVADKQQYRAERDAEALLKVRSQIGDYLLAVRDGVAAADGEAREKLVRERKLEPVVAHKFRDRYEGWQKQPSALLQPWFLFANLGESNGVFKTTLTNDACLSAIPPVLKTNLTSPALPTSMKQVAERYNLFFASAAREFAARGGTNDTGGWTETFTFFRADDSPVHLNADELHRVFDTPAQQKLRALQRKIDELDATHVGAPPRGMALKDNAEPFQPHVFKRGNPGNPGDAVPRQFLAVLSSSDRKPFQKGSGRLEMAEAVASNSNPLTARVFVNRAWLYHFGAPLVRTPSDFGLRSDPPTHPELLDFLASKFMEEGWSIKKLHRLIMLSAAYRQGSDENSTAAKLDPGNNLYWRQNRHRLDFEGTRDTLLMVSGKLNGTPGGHADDIATEPFSTRRTVYGFVERQNLPGLFRTFDFASPDTTSPQRFHTTVPQQALFLMNSPFVTEQARAVMERPEIKSAKTDEDRVRRLYEILYQRRPETDELKAASEFLHRPQPEVKPDRPAWQYGYGRVDDVSHRLASFTPLPHFSQYAWQGGKELPDPKIGWVLVSADGGHPGKNPEFAAVRRWVAPRDGVVEIRGELNHPSDQGDGVRSRLISSREGALGEWTAFHSKTNTTVDRIKLKANDTLDFITDSRGNEGFDSFQWAPRIKYVGGDVASDGVNRWNAKEDFAGPVPAKPKTLDVWQKYAQVLLLANELVFVD